MIERKLKVEYIPIINIKEYENNTKEHPDWQVEQIANSIRAFGFNDPLALDEDNQIIEGHGRYLAAKRIAMKKVPCVYLNGLSEDEKRTYMINHNKLTMNTGFEMEKLEEELKSLKNENYDLLMIGFSEEEFKEIFNTNMESQLLKDRYELEEESKGALNRKFIVPPFSVINSSASPWIDLKNKWKNYFDSKKGRAKDLIGTMYGTSEFDGAICEIFYQWFMPKNGSKILDCFSGGVVRGAVAESLGYKYTGFDIRQEQISQNIKICKFLNLDPKYICDDSRNIEKYNLDNDYDLLFSCPPYADLEVYSDLEGDISNKEYDEFLKLYEDIIKKFTLKLKDNRFAIFVVGDIRDKQGYYRDFISDTIRAFKKAGLNLYNQVIYIEPAGTAPIRAGGQFNSSRKICKIHQNILIFYKGNIRKIKNEFGEFENNIEQI